MKRVLLAVLLLGAAIRAEAIDWTDIWFNSLQPGYGYNLVQSDSFMFITFFIFDAAGAPVWYSAETRWDGTDSYKGPVYKSTGTFFGAPWVPANSKADEVGTATFKPSAANNYQGTLSYTVTGVGSAVHTLERQRLTSIATGGSYVGGQSGAYDGCTAAAANGPYIDRFDLTVTHLVDGSATLSFVYANNLACTLAGKYEQHGQYYLIRDAAYKCSDGLDTTAQVTEIKATALGYEGRYVAPNVGGACAERATFAAVLVQ